MAQELSWKGIPTERGTILYYVTVDGRILGDSRAYDTAQQASDAAIKMSNDSVVDGMRTRTYRPGYIAKAKLI